MPSLIVRIVGDTTGLDRAFRKAELSANRYAMQSRAYGQRLRRGGMLAVSAASALGLQYQVDNAAETIVGHFGVGGDAQNAVGTLATSMTDLGLESKGAAKLIGKAGLAGAVGFASYEMTTMILKATGLDKKLDGLAESAYDAAIKIGLIHDPMEQFKGKTTPTPGIARFIRNQAARLEQGGMTPQQAADRLAASHPGLAKRDVEVWAGVYAKQPIEVSVQIDGREVGRAATTAQTRAGKHTARQTSGRRG